MGRGLLPSLAVRISGVSSHVKSQHVKTKKQTKKKTLLHQDLITLHITDSLPKCMMNFFFPLLESKRLPVSFFMLGIQFDCKAVWKFPALRRHGAYMWGKGRNEERKYLPNSMSLWKVVRLSPQCEGTARVSSKELKENSLG